jgi:Glycosyl hydrolase catalytic core
MGSGKPMRHVVRAGAVLAGLALLAAAGGTAHAAPPAGNIVVGVVPQQPLGPADMQQMRSGSIDSFRFSVSWSDVEPTPGARNWATVDAAVAEAAAQGVTPFPSLYGSPAWAAAADGVSCSGADCVPYPPRSDATRAAFATFAADAAARYGTRGTFWADHPELPYTPIRAWQIWLEQNSPTYFAPQPDVSAYAALLGATAGPIRAADPEAEIVLGGMWGADSVSGSVVPSARYLKRLYRKRGVKPNFDSIALHPYAARLKGMVEQIDAARAAVKRARDRKVGMWVTELGWASSGPKDENLVYGLKGQAKQLRKAFKILRRNRGPWRVRGIYWYAWRDTPPDAGICDWCPGAGLFAQDGTPKPAWHTLAAIAAQLR